MIAFICPALAQKTGPSVVSILKWYTTLTIKPLVIVDGALYSGDFTRIQSADIRDINVLKDSAAKSIYGTQGNNGAILITTKNYKINAYEGELTYLSKSYRKFTREHNDNGRIKYRLNGVLVTGNKYEIANKLFDIPRKEIRWIRLKKYKTINGDSAIVSIRTVNANKIDQEIKAK